jgi:hypothetical protein
MADYTYPNPDDLIRRAIRTDVPLPESVTETDLQAHALEVELRQMRDRIPASRAGATGRWPCAAALLAGNGR